MQEAFPNLIATLQKDPSGQGICLKRIVLLNLMVWMEWYCLNQQRIDEVLVFKQHDSGENAVARGVPHLIFNCPGTEHPEHQRSIEVRATVVY